ncbi:hypothetical protein BC938DRAFT_471966 [Jimgerdemannia flammicorona]|uniref:Uncharacterized protein n=1 Tax=Jimgerdemannia flammicorona TaxID=994334 RepID=A0A433Q733_9FUNG|nr:hypothetical protein BC938DRAFT_471966 [Jimgerdemannia flammicorona]
MIEEATSSAYRRCLDPAPPSRKLFESLTEAHRLDVGYCRAALTVLSSYEKANTMEVTMDRFFERNAETNVDIDRGTFFKRRTIKHYCKWKTSKGAEIVYGFFLYFLIELFLAILHFRQLHPIYSPIARDPAQSLIVTHIWVWYQWLMYVLFRLVLATYLSVIVPTDRSWREYGWVFPGPRFLGGKVESSWEGD